MLLDLHALKYWSALIMDHSDRQEKRRRHADTVQGHCYGLQKLYAWGTDFFSYSISCNIMTLLLIMCKMLIQIHIKPDTRYIK